MPRSSAPAGFGDVATEHPRSRDEGAGDGGPEERGGELTLQLSAVRRLLSRGTLPAGIERSSGELMRRHSGKGADSHPEELSSGRCHGQMAGSSGAGLQRNRDAAGSRARLSVVSAVQRPGHNAGSA